MKRPFIHLITLTLAAILSGCGTSRVEVPINYMHGKFDPSRSDIDLSRVEVNLAYGDKYRDVVHKLLHSRSSAPSTANPFIVEKYVVEAKKFYRHVLENLEPHNAYAELNLGYLSLMQVGGAEGKEKSRLLSSSYAHFTEAEKHRPGYKDAYVYMGEYLAMQGDYDKALARFNTVIRAGFEDAYIHAWAGYCALQLGQKGNAEEHFRKAVDRGDPEEASSYARDRY